MPRPKILKFKEWEDMIQYLKNRFELWNELMGFENRQLKFDSLYELSTQGLYNLVKELNGQIENLQRDKWLIKFNQRQKFK